MTALAEKPLPIAPVPARRAAVSGATGVAAGVPAAPAKTRTVAAETVGRRAPLSGLEASARALRALAAHVMGFLER
jgi:hypothetical protein